MPSIELDHGTVRYRVAGPEDAPAPPVVFVHGALVDGSLWDGVASRLAAAGVRSYAPDWPLGSHSVALHELADLTPRGVVRQIVAFLDALGLEDVTLVGNDTGGALCQFVLDTDPSRVGRLVLTNCDAFDVFPPRPFDLGVKLLKRAAALRIAMQPMRATPIRHSLVGFGVLAREFDAAQTRRWVEPLLTDAGVRRDFARFLAAVDPAELDGVSRRLGAFGGPVLLVWGQRDRFFKPAFARRLRDTFADARLVEVEGARTFVMLDEPDRVADEILGFVGAPLTAA